MSEYHPYDKIEDYLWRSTSNPNEFIVWYDAQEYEDNGETMPVDEYLSKVTPKVCAELIKDELDIEFNHYSFELAADNWHHFGCAAYKVTIR